MTFARWIRPMPLALAIAIVGLRPAFADVTLPAMDGALPLYPHAVIGNNAAAKGPDSAGVWKNAWSRGFLVQVFSRDDAAAVDRWYGVHLPRYARRSNRSRVVYEGRAGGVVIMNTAGTVYSPQGKTAITLVPKSAR